MILDEFKKLRKFLSINGTTEIIYMGSDIFKPEADVTTVVLRFCKGWQQYRLLREYNEGNVRKYKGGEGLEWECNHISGQILQNRLEHICSFKLEDIYTVRISPRTPEIKRNKYVCKQKESESMLPILNGKKT
ncbi:MAG: hypothetical protein Q9N34_05295 [Aquificota bacterium]|nr:hypothetical protein [Aquificota bacterium]